MAGRMTSANRQHSILRKAYVIDILINYYRALQAKIRWDYHRLNITIVEEKRPSELLGSRSRATMLQFMVTLYSHEGDKSKNLGNISAAYRRADANRMHIQIFVFQPIPCIDNGELTSW